MLILVNPKSHSFSSLNLVLAVLFHNSFRFVHTIGEGSESARIWQQYNQILERRQSCQFNGFIFNPGERWVPLSQNFSADFCVICRCLEDGEYECGDGACCREAEASENHWKPLPSTLSKDKLTWAVSVAEDGSSCCRSCSHVHVPNTSENEGKRLRLMAELKRGETVVVVKPISASSSKKQEDRSTSQGSQMDSNSTTCFFKGKPYSDQEYFLANRTTFPDDTPGTNLCIKCQCKRGLVTCSSKAEKCCDNCKNLLDDADSVKRSVFNAKNENLKSFQHFPTPAVVNEPDYFPLPTIKLKERHINSPKIPISSPIAARNSPKDRLGLFETSFHLKPPPVAFEGKHAACLSEDKIHRHGSRWHPSMGPFGPAECIVCTCVNGRIECDHIGCSMPSTTCDTAVKLEGQCCPVCFKGPGVLCAPSTHTITVFQSLQSGVDGAGPYERISLNFVKPGAHTSVEVHELTFSKGHIRRFDTTQYANLRQFLQYKRNAKNLVAIGVTTLRNLAKFTSREEKLHSRCKSDCNLRFNKFIHATLRLDPIVARSTCDQGERLVLA